MAKRFREEFEIEAFKFVIFAYGLRGVSSPTGLPSPFGRLLSLLIYFVSTAPTSLGGGGWRKDNFPDSQRNSLAIIRTNLENRSNGDFSSFLLLVSSLDHLSDSFLPRHVEGFEPSARDYCNGVLCNRCTRPVRRLCTISQATLLNGPSSLLFAAITFALAYLYNCLHSVTYLHSLYTFNRA